MYLSVYVYNPSSTGVCDDDIEDVCVRACASALIAKRGGRKKEVRELWGTHGVAEVGEKGTMEPRDERWRRVQTVLPESWWLISTLFTLARRQTVGDRRNNSWSTMDSRPWSLKEIVFICRNSVGKEIIIFQIRKSYKSYILHNLLLVLDRNNPKKKIVDAAKI